MSGKLLGIIVLRLPSALYFFFGEFRDAAVQIRIHAPAYAYANAASGILLTQGSSALLWHLLPHALPFSSPPFESATPTPQQPWEQAVTKHGASASATTSSTTAATATHTTAWDHGSPAKSPPIETTTCNGSPSNEAKWKSGKLSRIAA